MKIFLIISLESLTAEVLSHQLLQLTMQHQKAYSGDK